MKRVLILGANGFAGAALLPVLLRHGWRIHAISPHPPGLRDTDQVQWEQGSLGDSKLLARTLPNCDAVVHLASSTTPGTSSRTPTLEASGNIEPTLRLIESVSTYPHIHMVYASTGGAIYGNPKHFHVNENTPCQPISYYGAAKLAIETFLHTLHANCLSPITILRPANFYGPGQRHRHGFGLIRTLLESARTQKPIEIWGDGGAIRDFLYIDDFSSAVVAALQRNTTAEPLTVFNVGTGIGHTINQVCSLIEETTGRQLQKIYRPARPSDVAHIVLDPSRIMDALGWKAKTDLRVGLAHTWRWLNGGGND